MADRGAFASLASEPSTVAPNDRPVAPEEEQRVTPLELFFDLVFVFAITQVTALMADDPTPAGVLRGMLVLAAVWWAWAAYAWLTNEVDPDESRVRLPVFAAMGATLVASLAVPGAFEASALLFALAYMIVRVLHIVVFSEASDDVEVIGAVRAMAPTALFAPVLLVVAAFLDGSAQVALWVVALTVDYGGAGVRGIAGWHLSPGHFAERHGLILIIALGESIVAIGVGAAGIGLGAGVVAAAALGVAVAAALWWAYFDVVAPVAERTLRAARRGRPQNTMARDSYSYLHLPMVAGIVLLALGVKKTIEHVDEPLSAVTAVALFGGVALYLLALIAFQLRNVRTLDRQRLVATLILLALIFLTGDAPALIALGAVALVCVSLVAYEAIHFREARTQVRLAR